MIWSRVSFQLLFVICAILGSFLVAQPIHAQDATAVPQSSYFSQIQSAGITFAFVSPDCKNLGKCTLDDVMQVFVNISNFILGILGSLVLIVIVWGGFLWLTSAGNSERIEKGKTAMRGAVIGLVIVFVAFTAINFLTVALRGGGAGEQNLCEIVPPPTGKAGLGYACLNSSGLDATKYECLDNFCPGADANIKCCIPKATTP